MALTNCPECGGKVSTMASACPHCGYPIAEKCKIEERKTERDFNLNFYEYDGKKYDITEIIDLLEKGELDLAAIKVHGVFWNATVYREPIQIKIWERFVSYKENQYPNIVEPSPIFSYQYNDKVFDVTRSIWKLDLDDWQGAFVELSFGFEFGMLLKFDQEAALRKQVTDDLQERVKLYKKENGDIIYPNWFLKWKSSIGESISTKAASAANLPKCPTCGSTSLEKISAFDRGVAAGAFGLISKTARSQFRCKKCGYMW